MADRLLEWIGNHKTLVEWLAFSSFLSFVGTLVVIPILVVRIPADYFLHREPPPDSWRGSHPVVRISVLISKNVVGIMLVALGIALSLPLVPGQGFLTILIGLTLINFPGKRTLELRIAREKHVRKGINWLRAKSNRPPLELPAD
jgi:hypothetical protein